MVEYLLEYRDGTEEVSYKLRIVENVDYSSPQAIVKKESVGGDGGLVVNTGRLLKTITLNGRIISKRVQSGTSVAITKSFNDIKDELEEIKEQGHILTLRIPLSTYDAGKYIIEDFSASLKGGESVSIPFTMKLVEYRQSNVKKTLVNVIASEPRDEFLARLRVSLQGT